jgi:polar amino acid transport system permease protein
VNAFLAGYVQYWPEWWPELLPAIGVTLSLTACSFALATVLALLLALGKLSRNRAVRAFCIAYIELVRGVPALAILFLLYFGLVPLGIVLKPFTAGFVGLGLSAAGYLAEVFRAGIEATHKGQREAALAVGMTSGAAFRWIVLPQALRVVLPPILNALISLLKDTSLCALISAPELMLRAKDLATSTFMPMHLYLLAGAIYLALAWPLSRLTRRLEARMRRGSHGGVR